MPVQEALQIRALQRELRRWTTLGGLNVVEPVVGKYYNASDELILMHGWEFNGPTTVLRYDGAYDKESTCHDGSTLTQYVHRFTSPRVVPEGDAFGRSGFIYFEFECPELHQVYEVEWESFGPVEYLDAANVARVHTLGDPAPDQAI